MYVVDTIIVYLTAYYVMLILCGEFDGHEDV